MTGRSSKQDRLRKVSGQGRAGYQMSRTVLALAMQAPSPAGPQA